MIFEIHEDLCINCGSCRRHCPFDAIPYFMTHRIDAELCTGCILCYAVCPIEDCITPVPGDSEVCSKKKLSTLRRSLLNNNSHWSQKTLTPDIKKQAMAFLCKFDGKNETER